jgi:hypothetical protein
MWINFAAVLAGAVLAVMFLWGMEIVAVPPAARPGLDQRMGMDDYPPTLRDIARHLPPQDVLKARHDDDWITWAHEAHHFLNSRLSDAQKRGFYLLDNTVYRFPIPEKTKLSMVAAAIPEDSRGSVYKTYLIDSQKDWEGIPLYMFDEAIAYWSGAMVRQEIGRKDRQETERFGVELLVYSMYAAQEICKRESEDYPKQELLEFLDLLIARARMICPEFDHQPHAKELIQLGRTLEIAEVDRDVEE